MVEGLKPSLQRALLIAPLLLATTVLSAQDRRGNDNYYNGQRDGGRGGNYDRGHNDHYDDRQRQGGIGPGKGAAIGAAGGAAIGLLFGGGLKGAVIGSAAGAGVGAVAGQAHQDNRRRDEY